MGSGYMRDTVKTGDFCAILGGQVIREVGLYASTYGKCNVTRVLSRDVLFMTDQIQLEYND